MIIEIYRFFFKLISNIHLSNIKGFISKIFKLKIILKEIDYINNRVILFTRGTKGFTTFRLSTIIFEDSILENIKSSEAALIGLYYGLNYDDYSLKNQNRNISFLVKINNNVKNFIISVDRKNNVNFIYSDKGEVQMNPSLIVRDITIINDFHPIQACYMGILAGIKEGVKSRPGKI